MKRSSLILYWIFTSLLCLLMLFSVSMYFFRHANVSEVFTILGYPSYLVYPLAVAKILGILAILTRLNKTLTEWAYAGFFFDFVLAFFAHYMIDDGEHLPALVALIILLGSYCYYKKIYAKREA